MVGVVVPPGVSVPVGPVPGDPVPVVPLGVDVEGVPPGADSGVVGEVAAGGGGTWAGLVSVVVSLCPQPPIRSADVIINPANKLPVFIGHSPNPTIRRLFVYEFLQLDGFPGDFVRIHRKLPL